jgi:hypothetical protein
VGSYWAKALQLLPNLHFELIAALALLPLVMGSPLIFMPIHIAFLEMVIDPVCSIVFETEEEERDIMQRRLRAADSRLCRPAFTSPDSSGDRDATSGKAVVFLWGFLVE